MILKQNSDRKKYQKLGVDLTILWENLQKTPTERILQHQQMLTLVEEAQKNKKHHDQIRKID